MTLALFFLKIALTIQGLLWLHVNFRVIFLFLCKTPLEFWQDCIQSIDGFGQYGHVNNISSSAWGERERSLFDRVLHSWGNWVLAYTLSLSLIEEVTAKVSHGIDLCCLGGRGTE